MDAKGIFRFAHIQMQGAAYSIFHFCSSVPTRHTDSYFSVRFTTFIAAPSVRIWANAHIPLSLPLSFWDIIYDPFPRSLLYRSLRVAFTLQHFYIPLREA